MTYELGLFNKIQPTEHEERTGMILSSENLVFLQNLRADYAQDLVNLKLDLNSVQQYAIDKTVAQAQIELISYLMQCHSAAKDVLDIESQAQ